VSDYELLRRNRSNAGESAVIKVEEKIKRFVSTAEGLVWLSALNMRLMIFRRWADWKRAKTEF